jgi:DNA-binding response OmpR family regulator
MKKILIIEDEPSYVKLLESQLKHRYEILEATDGKSGLALAKQEHPDLILLDIVLPLMDGMTVLSELRKDTYGKNTKVILLTNLEATDDIVYQVTDDLPVYYFIKSDVKLADLFKKIEAVLA